MKTVLLAEDDEANAFFVRRMFKNMRLPFSLQVVRDGEQALCYLAADGPYHDETQYPRPALLLLDLKLPRADGLEILEWLKKQPALQDLKVVVLTASLSQSDLQRAWQLGVDCCLKKPVDASALAETIESLLGGTLHRAGRQD